MKKLLLFIIIILILFIPVVLISINLHYFRLKQVRVKKLPNGQFQLIVRNNPYVIKGVCYSPVPIGSDHTYDLWSDRREPWKIDGKLMQAIGVNTVRFYQPGKYPKQVKAVINDFYNLYGIRVIMGHWLGFWDYPFAGYGDDKFRQRIKEDVLKMVATYKDEPGILLWVLGNENNRSFSEYGLQPWTTDEIQKIPDPYERRLARAKAYYSFVNDIAREIKRLDPYHPVALGNASDEYIEVIAKECPNIDIVAMTDFSGKSFGSLFRNVKDKFNRPFFFSEFGADSFDALNCREDEDSQAKFIQSQWRQIQKHLAGENDSGNCLGGVVFEWTDEWWKYSEHNEKGWLIHNTEGSWSNGAYYNDIAAPGNQNMNEEWWGIVAIEKDTSGGLDKRIPKKAYFVLKELWGQENLKSQISNPK